VKPRHHNPRNERPVSLHPLKLEEALSKAMNAQPIVKDQALLVKYLAGIRINEHHPKRQYEVANHLIKAVFRERGYSLADKNRQSLIRASGKRLLSVYLAERNKGQQNRDAAEVAFSAELNYLLAQTS
jgi:hypothetical protein